MPQMISMLTRAMVNPVFVPSFRSLQFGSTGSYFTAVFPKRIRPSLPQSHLRKCAPRAQQQDGQEGSEFDFSEGTPGQAARRTRRAGSEDSSTLISRLAKVPAEVDEASFRPDTEAASTVADAPTLLFFAFRILPGSLVRNSEKYLSHPVRLLIASAIAILFGFFAATSAATIIGSVADWDPLAAAVLLIWTESFTRAYYRTQKKGRLLQLVNAFKIGLIYGMAVDAFKLST